MTDRTHELEVTVGAKGLVEAKVQLRDKVPDLMSRFPKAIQRQAGRFLWISTRYERRLWRACKEMPWWAKATIRQHILHQRALRIEHHVERIRQKREEKLARKQAKLIARQARDSVRDEPAAPVQVAAPPAALMALPPPLTREEAPLRSTPVPVLADALGKQASTALGSVTPRKMTLAELLARDQPVQPVLAPRITDWSRGR